LASHRGRLKPPPGGLTGATHQSQRGAPRRFPRPRPPKKGREIPLNRSRPLAAETDAENAYLQRTDDLGRILLDDKIRSNFTVREHLKDGQLTIYLTPIKESRTVEIFFNFQIGLRDDAMAAAVVSEDVTIRIVDDQADVQPSRPPKRAKDGAKTWQGQRTDTWVTPLCSTDERRDIKGYSVKIGPTISPIRTAVISRSWAKRRCLQIQLSQRLPSEISIGKA
jgi:hypothetical protein